MQLGFLPSALLLLILASISGAVPQAATITRTLTVTAVKTVTAAGVTATVTVPARPVTVTVTFTPPTTTSTTTTSALTGPTDPAVIQAVLQIHNDARAHTSNGAVSPPALTWNQTLADSAAQVWTNKCSFTHDPNISALGLIGESIGAYPTANADMLAATKEVVQKWVDTRTADLSINPQGNYQYTQIVWLATTQVGCALTVCPGSTWSVYTCRYSPKGNTPGQFTANVLPYVP